jgi:hypothetical protein
MLEEKLKKLETIKSLMLKNAKKFISLEEATEYLQLS